MRAGVVDLKKVGEVVATDVGVDDEMVDAVDVVVAGADVVSGGLVAGLGPVKWLLRSFWGWRPVRARPRNTPPPTTTAATSTTDVTRRRKRPLGKLVSSTAARGPATEP
jgi:hypothetical protein